MLKKKEKGVRFDFSVCTSRVIFNSIFDKIPRKTG
jgi:hypothetical protein